MSVFTSLLNHDFAVERRFRSLDGQGGWVFIYQPIGTVTGRIRPASSTEIIAASQEQRTITHVFYCLHGEDVQRGDRLTYADLTVDVNARRGPSRENKFWQIDCQETQVEVSEAGS